MQPLIKGVTGLHQEDHVLQEAVMMHGPAILKGTFCSSLQTIRSLSIYRIFTTLLLLLLHVKTTKLCCEQAALPGLWGYFQFACNPAFQQ